MVVVVSLLCLFMVSLPNSIGLRTHAKTGHEPSLDSYSNFLVASLMASPRLSGVIVDRRDVRNVISVTGGDKSQLRAPIAYSNSGLCRSILKSQLRVQHRSAVSISRA